MAAKYIWSIYPEPTPARNKFTSGYRFFLLEQQIIDNEIDTFLSKSIIERSASQTNEIFLLLSFRQRRTYESGFQLQKTVSEIFGNFGCECSLGLYGTIVPIRQPVTKGTLHEASRFASLDLRSAVPNIDILRHCLNEHIKQNRRGNVFSTFYVRKYQQPELCAYRTIDNYLESTVPLRSSTSTKLLLSLWNLFHQLVLVQ